MLVRLLNYINLYSNVWKNINHSLYIKYCIAISNRSSYKHAFVILELMQHKNSSPHRCKIDSVDQ